MKELMNKGKKIVAIVLCCVACIAVLGNSTSAYDCGHQSWDYSHVNIKYTYASNTQCKCTYHSYMTCKICYAMVDLGETTSYYKHVATNSQAIACNGTTQTIRSACANCKGSFTTSRLCPAGPHANGKCPALTLDIKPEPEIK